MFHWEFILNVCIAVFIGMLALDFFTLCIDRLYDWRHRNDECECHEGN